MRKARIATPAEVLGLDVLPPTLTVAQTCKLLGVSKQSVYRAIEAEEIRALKVRGRVVVATRPLVERLGF